MVSISGCLDKVRSDIESAASKSSRRASEITLVAVSKGVAMERIREAYDLGLRDFGESRTKEMVEKQRRLDLPDIRWHFIGRLQSNKAHVTAAASFMVHSVDRIELARQISARATKAVSVLVQVNVADDPSKAGLRPNQVEGVLRELAHLGGIEVHGLMTIGPISLDPGSSRPHFAALRRLMDEVVGESPDSHFRQLSMGMSQDYEVAIEEGATMVRIGSAIFGHQPFSHHPKESYER